MSSKESFREIDESTPIEGSPVTNPETVPNERIVTEEELPSNWDEMTKEEKEDWLIKNAK